MSILRDRERAIIDDDMVVSRQIAQVCKIALYGQSLAIDNKETRVQVQRKRS